MNPDEVFNKLQGLIAEQFDIKPEEITLQSSFTDDLGADSVDLVELVMTLEDEFELDEIQDDDLSQLKTVGDCVRFLLDKLN